MRSIKTLSTTPSCWRLNKDPGGGRLKSCRPSSFRSVFMGVVFGLSLVLALIVIVLDV